MDQTSTSTLITPDIRKALESFKSKGLITVATVEDPPKKTYAAFKFKMPKQAPKRMTWKWIGDIFGIRASYAYEIHHHQRPSKYAKPIADILEKFKDVCGYPRVNAARVSKANKRNIIDLLFSGKTVFQIMDELKLTERQVRYHLQHGARRFKQQNDRALGRAA